LQLTGCLNFFFCFSTSKEKNIYMWTIN
jgi:hypothetical protein